MIERARKALALLGKSREKAWLMRGRERKSGAPLAVAFLGSEPYKHYHAKIAFGGNHEETFLGACSIPLFYRKAKALAKGIPGICAIEISEDREPLARLLGPHFKIPVWMRMELPLSGKPADCIRKSRYKRVARQIEVSKLGYEVRTDRGSFDLFYHRMYLPTMKARHGAQAVSASYDDLFSRYPSCELLMIMKDGQPVGAGLVDYSQEKPHFFEMGILDGSVELVKMGLPGAAYYFAIDRVLFRKGSAVANLGSARGFLRDEPLQFKNSFGGAFGSHHVDAAGSLCCRVLNEGPGLRSFLIENPFFTWDGESGYRAAIFVDAEKEMPKEMAEWVSDFTQKHVRPIAYVFGNPDEARKKALALSSPDLPGVAAALKGLTFEPASAFFI